MLYSSILTGFRSRIENEILGLTNTTVNSGLRSFESNLNDAPPGTISLMFLLLLDEVMITSLFLRFIDVISSLWEHGTVKILKDIFKC